MGFTQGYKVNADTQFEFTVSNETLSEVVIGGGITEEDLAEYCYSALIDSRVYKLFAAYGGFSWPDHTGADFASIAKASCPGIVEGWSSPMTSEHPAFNKELLDSSDTVYQRNFLVWSGTIYPGTENEKTGDFLVMDMVDIKRWYVNFDNNGFGTTTVTSAIGETAPEGYVWPGYTGQIYTYISNVVSQGPVMHCDNNNPQLNPNTNIKVKNILIVNDEPWIGSLNPSTHCSDYMGGSGCSYAGKSLYGWYWNGSANGGYLTTSGGDYYQRGSMDFMGLPDYSSAPELPGAPQNDIGSLGYSCYAVTNSDSVVVNLAGNWGQQNDSSGCSFVNNSSTTQLTSVLKWQSWCGLKFQYSGTMYKPIIQGGIVVGYSDDMDAESEYDDMTNVTGNNIPSAPPRDPAQEDSPWDEIKLNGAVLGGANAFCRIYYCTQAELTQLRTWTMGNSEHGDPVPGGFSPKDNLIGLMVYPFNLSGDGPTNIVFTTNGGIDPVTTKEMPRSLDTGVSCEGGKGDPVQILSATVAIPETEASWGEPWLDYESHIELYIPFCGVYEIDPQAVIGRTVTIKIYLDPISGTCAGYAYASKGGGTCIVAQGSGTPGVQIPIATGNYGLAQAARVNNTLSSVTGTAQTTLSAQVMQNSLANRPGEAGLNGVRRIAQPNTTARSSIANFNKAGVGNAALSVSGLLSGIQHWVSARQIANSCSTSASGGFSGSMAEWCGVFKPYVKIVRPKFRKPNTYKHTCAEPDVSTRTLSAVKGYAVCINPDLSGIPATEQEKAIIYQYLTTGVYVKKG